MKRMPQPIAAFVAATNAHDLDAMLAPFSDDAVVLDERREWRGRTEIREWIAETTRKYQHTIDVLKVDRDGSRTIVVGRVTGNFPGSPIDLRHLFTLAGNGIARLEIRP